MSDIETNPSGGVAAPSAGSPNPLPESLQGIYAKWGRWEEYDRSDGYRKRPCMVRLRDGRERGPCWPNAGKFCELNGQGEWAERLVVAVCYAESAEDSGNVELSDRRENNQ